MTLTLSTDMEMSTDMKMSTDTKCLWTRNFMRLQLGIRLHLKWAEPLQKPELLCLREKNDASTVGGKFGGIIFF